MNILVINGPNLNLLGTREPHVYGTRTLADLEAELRAHARTRAVELRFFQSNHEGAIVDELQAQRTWADAVLINAAAFTHYSYAIRDALAAIGLPAVEVHLSNIEEREAFRRISVIRDVCVATRMGRGFASYTEGLDYLIARPADTQNFSQGP